MTISSLNSNATPGSPVVQNANANPATLTVGNSANASSAFAGVIQDGSGGALSLTKAGTGTATLSGVNTYTGATVVNAGTLIVSGGLSGSSPVTVGDALNPATLAILAGGGTVGDVTVSTAGASVSPSDYVGETTAGSTTLTTRNFTIADSNAALALNVGRPSPGTNLAGDTSDHISATGSVTLAGNLQLTLESDYTPTANDVLYLIISGNPVSGQFATVNGSPISGNTFTFESNQWQISYNATSTAFTGAGGDVAVEELTAVPEPGTWAMLLSGVGMLVGLQRMRRRRM